MKNQYIGDVGDYGKYGLLRFLCASGIKTGVNWYLTPDDGKNDGNHTEYLRDERMRAYDPELFDAMKQIAFRNDKTITMLEQDPVLKGMGFYHAVMNFEPLNWWERTEARNAWHAAALMALKDSELVFADPDNSLSVKQKPTKKEAQKYILPLEIADYYKRGQQVMYYHHRSRKKPEGWLEEKRQVKSALPDAELIALTFHRWSSRTYIFVVHRAQYEIYAGLVEAFLASKWGTWLVDGKAAFTAENI